jgi:hypothetical protein
LRSPGRLVLSKQNSTQKKYTAGKLSFTRTRSPSFCTEWFHLNMDGMSQNVKFKAAKFRKPAEA